MKIILSLIAVTVSYLSYGQSSFEIISVGNQYSQQEIQLAFDNANLCGMYLKTENNRIELNDGSIINILSANELLSQGNIISDDCISDKMVEGVVWSISSGALLRGVEGIVSPDNKIYIVK